MCKEKFNEMEFVKREYEFLRFLTTVEGEFSKEVSQKMEIIRKETLKNEEALKYAITITEDIFGVKQLNAPLSASFMLLELEKIMPEISDRLITSLLFEYQDKNKNIPLILTGGVILGTSYLAYLLLNTSYKLNEKYSKRISECVIQSIEKEFDSILLSMYFRRKDISIEYKKFVIDSLSEEVLYRLITEWNDDIIGTMIENVNLDCLELSDEEVEEFEKELENMHEEKVSSLNQVIDLINEKLGL